VGNYASPDSPGSAYVQLHHTFGEVNGKKGAWGHAIGGIGAITQAMAKACTAQGVAILTDAPVRQILVDGGKVAGVELADGRRVRTGIVASNLNPSLLFQSLVAPTDLPAEFRARIARYRNGSGTFRMNVACRNCRTLSVSPAKRWRTSSERPSSSPCRSTTWTRPRATRRPLAGQKS
jgi:phytoene dehydrogenase-like protein